MPTASASTREIDKNHLRDVVIVGGWTAGLAAAVYAASEGLDVQRATFMEAQLCAGDEIIVVGGANSAGQAAVFLARAVRRIHLLVRSNNLSASMSRYLVRRIEEIPTVQIRTRTEIVLFRETNTSSLCIGETPPVP